MADRGRFFRQNLFLIAAVSLPLVVVGFFLVATAIPRWLVAPPAYDFLLHTGWHYEQTGPRVAVEFTVRDGRVEATVRRLTATASPQVPRLYLFEHETQNVREITVDLPTNLTETDTPVTIAIGALAGRRVLAEAKAPDGYELVSRTSRAPGLVGELFGMRSHDGRALLANRGRVVAIPVPADRYGYPVVGVGWVLNEGSH